MIVSLWLAVAVLYVAFVLWYYNWSGPIKDHEIDDYMRRIQNSTGSEHSDSDVLREFMGSDDGKEFIMQNFVRVKEGKIAHPITGDKTHAAALLAKYSGPFAKALFLRGGHPVFVARKVGGLIDSWGSHADENWHVTAMMRYRSRRDAIELVANPKFADIHVFKTSAMEKTINFPVQMNMSLFMKPGAYVPAGLVFVGMFIQLVAVSI